jgi:hypothetical protein
MLVRSAVVMMSLFHILPRTVSASARRVPFVAFASVGKQQQQRQQQQQQRQQRSNNYIFPSDGETSVPIPSRKHGYRTLPFSWSELQEIVVEEQDLARLSRSIQQEETYQRYRQDLLQEYRSVYDHILHSKFGFVKKFNRDSQRMEAQQPDETDDDSSTEMMIRLALLPNDFPYYTQTGIEHWVLWKLNGSITEEDIDEAKKDLRNRLGDIVGFIHWENPPHLKSLPDIDHVHILARREAKQGGSKR